MPTTGEYPVKTSSFAPMTPSHGFLKSHFAPAFFFLSGPRRKALQTVYAFFRVLDDAVDVPRTEPAPYLAAWRSVIQERRAEAVAAWGQQSIAAGLLEVMKAY